MALHRKHEDIWRSISVENLMKALADKPKDARVFVNRVRNLNIAIGPIDDPDQWDQIGSIDLNAEKYESF
jgi:hypothetical protein